MAFKVIFETSPEDCGSKIGTPNGTLVNGHMDQNLRSISWWFHSDPYPESPKVANGLGLSQLPMDNHPSCDAKVELPLTTSPGISKTRAHEP